MCHIVWSYVSFLKRPLERFEELNNKNYLPLYVAQSKALSSWMISFTLSCFTCRSFSITYLGALNIDRDIFNPQLFDRLTYVWEQMFEMPVHEVCNIPVCFFPKFAPTFMLCSSAAFCCSGVCASGFVLPQKNTFYLFVLAFLICEQLLPVETWPCQRSGESSRN